MSLMDSIFDRIDGAVETLFAPVMRFGGGAAAEDSGDAAASRGSGNVEHNIDGSITINGVVVPKLVAEQLNRAGVSLGFLNAGQLKAAMDACAVDCTLIDDPSGADFFDDLEMDEEERERAEEAEEDRHELQEELCQRNTIYQDRGNVFAEPAEATGKGERKFREKIRSEREQQKERKKLGLQRKEEEGGDQGSPPEMRL